MKKILLAFLFIGFWAFNQVNAQPCSLANLQFTNVYTGTDGKCYADVYFDMDRNNGNKFIYLHFWTQANYAKVNKARFKKGAGPVAADINGTASNPYPALATVAIDNNNYNYPVWSSYNYRPDPSVAAVKGSGMLVSSSPVSGSGPHAMYRYYINGIPLGALGGGCTAANLGVIAWSTQANSINSHIHCSLVGLVTPQFPLSISGSASCATSKYTLNVTNTTNSTITGSFDIYADNGGAPNNNIFDPNSDTQIDAIDYFLINPNSTFTITRAIPLKYLGYNLWSQVQLSNNSTQVEQLLTSSCGVLPVTFQSFSATRNKQNVVVKWQTATEQGVRGFNILRATSEGEWKAVAYVPAQSAGGFSTQTNSYQYTDLNAFKGISQYRIEELGTDGKKGLSDVKMVRGEEQGTRLTVYPNPSSDGKVNVVFDNYSVRDITITDMSGRAVKQLRGITSSNVLIDNLNTGFYNIFVLDHTTNETSTEKLIIKMR